MDDLYRTSQVERLIAIAGDEPEPGTFRLKMRLRGEEDSTKWLNVSGAEAQAVAELLAGDGQRERFTLTIDLGNAAMSTHEDVADALERAAGAIRLRAESPDNGMVMDVNGNKTGAWFLGALPEEA